jgi:hypothetical protein
VLVAMALGFVPAFERTHSMRMAAAAIGIWTRIAPWVIQSSPTDAGIIATNVVVGALVFLHALLTMALGMGRDRTRGDSTTRPVAPDRR